MWAHLQNVKIALTVCKIDCSDSIEMFESIPAGKCFHAKINGRLVSFVS